MTDIFISCMAADQDRVDTLVDGLEEEGYKVFLAPISGEADEPVKQNELPSAFQQARCVIAVWSRHGLNNRRMRLEAGIAQDQERLVTVVVDETRLPRRFQRDGVSDMRVWRGDRANPTWRLFMARVRAIAGPPGLRRRPTIETTAPNNVDHQARNAGARLVAATLIFGVLSAGAISVWLNWQTVSSELADLRQAEDAANLENVSQPASLEALQSELDEIEEYQKAQSGDVAGPFGSTIPAPNPVLSRERDGDGSPEPVAIGGPDEETAEPLVDETTARAAAREVPPGDVQIALNPGNGTLEALDWTNVRSGPGLSNKAIQVLSPGQRVERLGLTQNEAWAKIALEDGREGFVYMELMRPVSAE